MSRIGKLPVPIPGGVSVRAEKGTMTVEGPKGQLEQTYQPEVSIAVEEGQAIVSRVNETKRARSMHGLYRNLLRNMVQGVSDGFSITLLITGVGYRAEVQGQVLVLNLGFSNPIEYPIPGDVSIETDGPTKLTVKGIDKQVVGQVASEIRSIRPPEPYKGKGVKYETEQIRRKVGKSGIK
jgi:large subunit ribosomal protein L6